MANETIDWSNLSFSYMKTDYNVRCTFRDGKWGEIEVCTDETITMHMAASCLHYGQEIFEGLKAFRTLRAMAEAGSFPDLSTEKIDEVIRESRAAR